MATSNAKINVLDSKNNSTLPLLLLVLALLQLGMAALWLSLPPSARDADSIGRTLTYAGVSALLGVLGLLRDTLPPVVRVGAVTLAGVVVLGIPVLAVLGAALHLALLPLPYLMAALLLLLVAALVKPD